MKLKKDQFKKSEIDAAVSKIMDILIQYVEEKELTVSSSQCKKHINISSSKMIYDTYHLINNFRGFIKNQFTLFDSDNMHPSHKITITSLDKLCFYTRALEKLNNFEKIVLVKTTDEFKPSLKELTKTNVFSEEDYWLHLRHVAPFSKVRQRTSANHVRDVLTDLSNKSINTKEKVDALAYFLNYYKTIAKRSDIKASTVRLIKGKINEEYFPIFESILSTKILNNASDIDIFLPPPEVKTLIISKNSMIEQVSFDKIPQAHFQNYNKYLQSINYFLLSPQISEQLNIARIDFHEFHSNNEPARIYISSKNGEFKEEIEPIYKHLIQSCAASYSAYDIYKADPITKLGNTFKTSLDYFLLNKSINDVNKDKESEIEVKRKNFKL